MQDPSGGVPQAVLQHVHLVSAFKYPYHPGQLGLEEALNHLRRAAQIVRELAPVSWTYLNHPTNGTVLLAWQPTAQLGTHFPSDGYVWAAPETVYTQEVHGFTIEIFVHESGFIPNVEQVATHRRTRYRLVHGPNNSPTDPSLEIVHYTASFPEHHVPVRAIQPQQITQKQLSERRYLESQGALEKKEFMLHDRHNWPTISVPGNPVQPGTNQTVISFGRPGVGQFQDNRGAPTHNIPAAAVGPAQSKMAQHGPAGRGPGGGFDTVPPAFRVPLQEETVLADEDNPVIGDQLDLLSPAEISLTRYKQHHEWMEEIMSSPYAASQILPVDLGLRLTGELSELTEGLWENANGDGQKNGIPTYKKLDVAKMKDFEERIAAYLKNGENQVNEMKNTHSQKMDELSKQKLFANLERRLAEASLDRPVDDIVRDAETATESKVVAFDEVKQVRKGGLLTEEENMPPSPPSPPVQNDEEALPPEDDQDFGDLTNLDTAGEALDFYGESMDFPT